MATMRTYRHKHSGALRQSASELGHPYVLEDDGAADGDYGSMKKSEIVALADSRGVDSTGTIAEIAARLAEADGA